MCLKRDYRVENRGGQVEQWSLMCKGRIRNWVDLTGVCSLCVEEPINGLHTNHLLVNIWHMHMLPQAQSACTHCMSQCTIKHTTFSCSVVRMAHSDLHLQLQIRKIKLHCNNNLTIIHSDKQCHNQCWGKTQQSCYVTQVHTAQCVESSTY